MIVMVAVVSATGTPRLKSKQRPSDWLSDGMPGVTRIDGWMGWESWDGMRR